MNELEHVRNEELLPFHKLTAEEQQILEGEVHKGNVERLDIHCREWHNSCANLFSSEIYRTISQEEQEMQHEENNEFPWHMVSSEWNALARDDNTYHNWYLYKDKPCKYGDYWYDESCTEFDEVTQKVIGVDMSQWNDTPWNDSLMLRPGYEQQDIVETVMGETTSDEEVPVVSSSNTTKEYPVVKLKNLHKYSVGDVVRLKKTGELIKVCEYMEIGCSDCKFYTYDYSHHPCRKCGFLKNAYVDYKELTETQDETFANTEMKVYADLDDKTKQLLQAKYKEGKVEWHMAYGTSGAWYEKELDEFLEDSVYRVV